MALRNSDDILSQGKFVYRGLGNQKVSRNLVMSVPDNLASAESMYVRSEVSSPYSILETHAKWLSLHKHGGDLIIPPASFHLISSLIHKCAFICLCSEKLLYPSQLMSHQARKGNSTLVASLLAFTFRSSREFRECLLAYGCPQGSLWRCHVSTEVHQIETLWDLL